MIARQAARAPTVPAGQKRPQHGSSSGPRTRPTLAPPHYQWHQEIPAQVMNPARAETVSSSS